MDPTQITKEDLTYKITNVVLDNFPEEEALSLIEYLHSLEFSNIGALLNTILVCDNCHRIDAKHYKIKRSGGKYILLCDDEETNCAAKEVSPQCSFCSEDQIQCENLADFEIHPMEGPSKKILYACPIHTGILCINGKNEVYPTPRNAKVM